MQCVFDHSNTIEGASDFESYQYRWGEYRICYKCRDETIVSVLPRAEKVEDLQVIRKKNCLNAP